MKPFGTVAIVLLLVLSPFIAAQTVDQGTLDFKELFKTLRYRGLTPLERQALIGKRYSGYMLIHSVQRDDAGAVRLNCQIRVNNTEGELLYFGIASFVMNDAERALSLKTGYQVHLTGRLARVYEPPPGDDRATDFTRGLTEFIDTTIDEIAQSWGQKLSSKP
jgi:hypothetical protein